jgi:hypothetical protein
MDMGMESYTWLFLTFFALCIVGIPIIGVWAYKKIKDSE